MIYPPLSDTYSLPEIALINDDGGRSTLASIIKEGNELTLLIPGFTTCHGVCPVLTRQYKDILSDPTVKAAAQRVTVVFFSFDDTESSESLARFRKHADLPANWILAHASPEDTQSLLTSLQYTVMKSEAGFQHPAQAFVFTKNLKWIGSLYGIDVNAKEFQQIVDRAELQLNHPALSSFISIATNPNTVAFTAGGGFVLSIAIVLLLAVKKSTKIKSRHVKSTPLK